MKILVTGAAGYIGSVLVRQLLAGGDVVVGLDSLRFGGESLLGILADPRFTLITGDVRDDHQLDAALEGVEAVVHLAAIVGDPACSKDPDLAESVNWIGSKLLFDKCQATDSVKRFVFASTCSNYGKMKYAEVVNEQAPLRPLSLYANHKVMMEEYILAADGRTDFCTTCLRFSTVHGLSPRPRFDLTVNEFARDVALGRTIEIYGEQFWRPYCHVRDIARACTTVLRAPSEKVRNSVFGVGNTEENYQKKGLAALLLEIDPNAEIRFVHKDEDPRDYRVEFSKIHDHLGFTTERTVKDGMHEIAWAIRTGLLSDPDHPRFSNT